MLKLYRFAGDRKDYWETWEETADRQLVHWGALGTRGETKSVESTLLRKSTTLVQAEIDGLIASGFAPIPPEDHTILLIEYPVEGMGTLENLDKRHRLEDRMNETLGWTGLGACDGGSIGSGTMEICNFVVDFEIARQVIIDDLVGTEFADYSRIYAEGIT